MPKRPPAKEVALDMVLLALGGRMRELQEPEELERGTYGAPKAYQNQVSIHIGTILRALEKHVMVVAADLRNSPRN